MSATIASDIRKYIDRNFHLNVTLCALSKHSDLSRYQVFRLFSNFYGITPYKYLVDIRIRRAIDLILDNEPIAEVAFAVGFVDQSHMTRHFRRHLGLTPNQIIVSPAARRRVTVWLDSEASDVAEVPINVGQVSPRGWPFEFERSPNLAEAAS